MFDVCSSKTAHPKAVAVGSYVLGEFGFLIAEEAGKSGEVQFKVLQQHWAVVDSATQGIMLTAFAKMSNLYAELQPIIAPIFLKLKTSVDIELQQRSNEYRILAGLGPDVMEDILREMPAFDTEKVSTLEIALEQEHTETHDKNIFSKKKQENGEGGEEGREANAMSQGQLTPSVATPACFSSAASPTRMVGNHAANPPPGPPPALEPEPDLLGGFDEEISVVVPPAAPPAQKASVGISEDQIPGMRSSFAKLCSSAQGVLFQNAYVQVGLKSEYRGSQGRLQLFVGNMSGTPFNNLKIHIPEVPYLRTAISDESGPTGALTSAGTLDANQQKRLMIMAEAIAPYADVPEVKISFETDTETHTYPLRLPIVTTKFTELLTVNKEAFMGRWTQLAGKESQEIVATGVPGSPERMQKVASLLTSLNFGRCSEVDNATSVSGCGTYKTGAKDPSGKNISVGMLVRIEANADKFRVTARTLHPTVSASVKTIFCAALKEI